MASTRDVYRGLTLGTAILAETAVGAHEIHSDVAAHPLLREPAMLGKDLRRHERGSIMMEYLIVAFFSSIMVVLAVAPVLGPSVFEEYLSRRAILYSTYP